MIQKPRLDIVFNLLVNINFIDSKSLASYSAHMAPTGSDGKSSATKDDIAAIMGELGKIYDANERWKDELKKHFDLAIEIIRHDLKTAGRDEIEMLKDQLKDNRRRIGRLEVQCGLL